MHCVFALLPGPCAVAILAIERGTTTPAQETARATHPPPCGLATGPPAPAGVWPLPQRHGARAPGALLDAQPGRRAGAGRPAPGHRPLQQHRPAPGAGPQPRAAGALAPRHAVPVRAGAPQPERGGAGRPARHAHAHPGRPALCGQGRARGPDQRRLVARRAPGHQRHRHRAGRVQRGANPRRRAFSGAQQLSHLRGLAHPVGHGRVAGASSTSRATTATATPTRWAWSAPPRA